jgi:two-component system chemotaxis sensor kinase CheA
LLVVDDSVTTRALVQSILETAGYEVLTASDGFEGWQVLKHRGADLVVSDIQMPRMDGFTFVETMRASREFRDTPVILVTAMSRDEDRSRGLEAGADAYLVKRSFDQSELIETINRLL